MKKNARNIFPGLAAEMSRNYHDIYGTAELLGISYDSLRRRLSGEIDFELSQIKQLMEMYERSFDSLFGNCKQKGA